MLELQRQHSPELINRFLNHPEVFPWVSGGRPAPLDATQVVADPNNVVLCCDWGGVVFAKLRLGFFEAHTAVLPEGRGGGTLALGRAALEWMFSRTDAVEILTRVPRGNVAGSAAMRAMGVPVWFTTQPIWPTPSGPVPMGVYRLHLFDWIVLEREALGRAGELFHVKLAAAGGLADHPDDPVHDAHVGAAIGMIEGGQAEKGVTAYNLWATMAGYGQISIASPDPLTIDIGTALIDVRTGAVRTARAAA